MAFRTPRIPVPVPIPKLDDDVEFAKFASMRRAFLAAVDHRRNALDIIALRAELAAVGSIRQSERRARQRARLQELEKATPPAKSSLRPEDDLPAPIRVAMAVVSGDVQELPEETPAKRARLSRELELLEAGLREIEVKLDEIRAERSHAVSQAQRPRHQTILLSIWESASALAAAMDAERDLVKQILASGHDARADVIRRPALVAGARIGSQSEYDSDVSRFRRWLEEQGIL